MGGHPGCGIHCLVSTHNAGSFISRIVGKPEVIQVEPISNCKSASRQCLIS
jgi:hypothetical protein